MSAIDRDNRIWFLWAMTRFPVFSAAIEAREFLPPTAHPGGIADALAEFDVFSATKTATIQWCGRFILDFWNEHAGWRSRGGSMPPMWMRLDRANRAGVLEILARPRAF